MSKYDLGRYIEERLAYFIPIEYRLPPLLLASWMSLRKKALLTAQLRNDIPDYIVLNWVNKGNNIDHQAESDAAAIIIHMLRNTNPNLILAIGNSGLSLGKAVYKQLPGTGYIEVEKLESEFSREDERYVQAYSYSLQRNMGFKVPRLPNGARVLLIDDVVAHGNVGLAIGSSVQNQGKGVKLAGIGSYFAKEFQGGERRLRRELHIPSFSVIRIQNIVGENSRRSIELTPEREALIT